MSAGIPMRASALFLLATLAAAGCAGVDGTGSAAVGDDGRATAAACRTIFGIAPGPPPPRERRPLVHLRPLPFSRLARAEATLGSALVVQDTFTYLSGSIQHRAIYQRIDPVVPGTSMAVHYTEHLASPTPFGARADGMVREMEYLWGFGVLNNTAWPPGRPQPASRPTERLEGLLRRYGRVRAQAVEAFGSPKESGALTCTPCGESGLAMARRRDHWRGPGLFVDLGLMFDVPCGESPMRPATQSLHMVVFHAP